MPGSILLQLRWWQLRKEAKGVGWLYLALLLLAVFVVSAGLYSFYSRGLGEACLASGAVVLSVLGIQWSRLDKAFVRKHMPGGLRNIALEYMVLTLPFTLPVLFTPYWWLFLLLQAAHAGIAGLSAGFRQRTALVFLSGWIHPRDFEWLSGMRRNAVFLLPCYLAAWGLCWLKVAPLIPLWIITAVAASFYIECEPLHILKAVYTHPAALLRAKMLRHLKLLVAILLPVLIVNSLCCPEMTVLNLVFLSAQIILLVFALLLKYAGYRPDIRLGGSSLLMGLMSVSVLIPFLLPLPLLMSFRNYGRALTNLKDYYHDQR